MFKTTTPEKAGISSSEVLRFINYLEDNSLATHSLLLIREDAIFTEAYWAPFDKDYCHRQYSQTKSLVSIAIGLLVSDGVLSLEDKISDHFPEKIDDKDALPERLKGQTVRQMLTMTTACETRCWFCESDPDRTHLYFNGRTSVKLPGGLWDYDSAGSQVLSSLVEKLTRKRLLDFLRERLFDHIGSFKTASILKTPNGDSWGDSALLCTARDMASFAKLLMDGGRHNGKQLIDEGYIREATSKQVDNSEAYFAQTMGFGYGYQIWRMPRDAYAFVGMGGQLTITLPKKRLIFVINSDNQGVPTMYDVIINGFYSFIADRIEDAPLAEDAQSLKKLSERIAGLRLFALKGDQDGAELREKINGRRYVTAENALGISEFEFCFEGEGGEFRYTNRQGKKVIPFGINENVFGYFPELGYSDEVGREVTTNGHKYRDAVSLRFTERGKLQLRVQIIDKYLGNFLATFAFVGNEAEARFTATAENFLKEYSGELSASTAD